MAQPDLPDLSPEELHVFVFGPGIGELIIARTPGDAWLVVDGCATGSISYAPQILARYKARASAIALTHPHVDHAKGLAEVIEAATVGPTDTWPRIGMLSVGSDIDRGADLQAYFDKGVLEQLLATIFDRWGRHPACRWKMERAQAVQLGEASLKVVSPSDDAIRSAGEAVSKRKEFDWNQVSTAMLLEWGGRSIVLGADLVEKPGKGWSLALHSEPSLTQAATLKIPHHASKGALDKGLLDHGLQPDPIWVATPYATSGLPRFDDGEGVHILHKYVEAVLLTGLPRGHEVQAGSPVELRRHELKGTKAGTMSFDTVSPGFPDCYVLLSFPREPGPPRVTYGAGSVRVRR